MIITYKSKVKLFLNAFFIVTVIGCIYILINYPLEGEYLLVFPIILFCILGWLYIQNFRLEITDKNITAKSIFTNKSINFNEITKLSMYNQALEVRAKRKRIKISTDLNQQKQGIAFLLDKLKERKNQFQIKGDKDFLNQYLS